MKLICLLVPTLVPKNTAVVLEETFFISLVEALKATPLAHDTSKLPFAHDDTKFIVRLNQFMNENANQSLSVIMPLFIAVLEELELDSTAPKADTFNTPKNMDRRTTRTPAPSNLTNDSVPPAWPKFRSKNGGRGNSTQRSTMRSNDAADEDKIKFCSSCGGSRNPEAPNTCVKNITGDLHCPLKTKFFHMLSISNGRHPDSGDELNSRDGFVCHLCGCGGHGYKFCPFDKQIQKESRKARTKMVDTLRSDLRSKKKFSGGAVSQEKPSWADSTNGPSTSCYDAIDDDDDDDVEGLVDTDGDLMPDDGVQYSLVVTGKKSNGSFNTRWQRSPFKKRSP